jgi:hypothetical protein
MLGPIPCSRAQISLFPINGNFILKRLHNLQSQGLKRAWQAIDRIFSLVVPEYQGNPSETGSLQTASRTKQS